MPGRLKVKVVAARDLPIMDRASDLTDAFVEVRFGNDITKTDVYRKSLNPQWNSDWFKFEVEDEALQDEPLILRVLDYDTYSAHDSIGKVYIDLNPLLIKNNPSVINGWFPIYDTMRGIRGELNFIVKVDLFSDFNRFRQSSCGVQLFCSPTVPENYQLQSLHGFVEELVVNDDPEYQWIDKLRTSRASNEARQRLFSKLTGELQRKIGLKVLELGGNSIIGYRQCFDLEGESGIVVRAIGTAITLSKTSIPSTSPIGLSPFKDSPLPEDTMITPSSPNITQTGGVKSSTSPAKCSSTALRRRSSDSDLSTTPKEVSPGPPAPGGSLTGSSGSGSGTGALSGLSGRISGHKSALAQPQPTIDMLEYPFFTMKTFPPGFIVHIGGIVSAKSVKLLDKIHNPEEPETRDAWWIEIRTEIRSHCRAMGCHAVIGYSEETSICDEVIILSAIGTAAVVNSNLDVLLPIGTHKEIPQPTQVQVGDRVPAEKEKLFVDVNLANQLAQNSIEDGYTPVNCAVCHIPYKSVTMPFKVTLGTCAICHKQPVPDVLFTTINPPEEIQTLGKGTLIQARIYRTKKDGKGEACAKEISDCLPFMEYELHNQLINKLKMRGMNGLFGLVVHITIGETMLAGIATATAAFLSPLPAPSIPRISGQVMTATDNTDLELLQQRLTTAVQRLKEQHEVHMPEIVQTQFGSRIGGGNNTDDSDDDQGDIELSFGNKDTFVLEVDDAKDETVSLILDDFTAPEGFEICNTETLPGVTNIVCNLQMFTHVWRGKCQKNPMTVKDFSDLFNHLIRKICFKLRKMAPCCLSCLDFNLELADEDEVQITVTGMCTGLGEIQPQISDRKQEHGSSLLLGVPSNSSCEQDPDMMFTMEEIQDSPVISRVISQAPKPMKLENGMKYHTVPRHRLGVELIPMSYVPGGKIDHYLGSYNFFFIRESTSVREMGGPCGFMQSFVSEVKAIVRAHVGALGGNAMVAYKMNECILLNNPHKNQCQCLINVSGDAVNVLYSFDLPPELSHANCGVAGSGGGSRGDLAAHPSVSGSSTPRPLSGSPVIS